LSLVAGDQAPRKCERVCQLVEDVSGRLNVFGLIADVPKIFGIIANEVQAIFSCKN
jgi:hypothetical protein